jgi:hypothetical protein
MVKSGKKIKITLAIKKTIIIKIINLDKDESAN